MSESKQTKETEPEQTPNTSFYQQRRNDKNFKYKLSKNGAFKTHLLAGQVDTFDLTQDANMGGEYTRCFYKMGDTVFQETPCDSPYTKWVTLAGENKARCRILKTDESIWKYINDNYSLTMNFYQLCYVKTCLASSQIKDLKSFTTPNLPSKFKTCVASSASPCDVKDPKPTS